MDSLLLTLDLILVKNSISHSPKRHLFLVLKDGGSDKEAHSALSIFLSCLVLSSHLSWCSYLLLKEERLWELRKCVCKIRLSLWAKLQPGLPSFALVALLADSETAQLTCGLRSHFHPPGALFLLFGTFLGYYADPTCWRACMRVCSRRGWELYMGNDGCV